MRDSWQGNVGFRDSDGGKLIANLQVRYSLTQQVLTIGVSAVKIPTTPVSKRRSILIMNNSSGGQILYLGNSLVTTSDGFPLYPRAEIQMDIADDVDVYGVCDGAGGQIRVMEGA